MSSHDVKPKSTSRMKLPARSDIIILPKKSSTYVDLAQDSSEFVGFDDKRIHDEITHARRPSDAPGYIPPEDAEEQTFVSDYEHEYPRRTAQDLSHVPDFDNNHNSSMKSINKSIERGDLEVWWVNSPVWRRLIPLMCVIMLILSIAHACLAVYYFTAEDKDAKDVDVCKTKGCIDIANWINQGLDRSVDPCNNFYEFACGKFRNPRQSQNSVPQDISFARPKFQFNEDGGLADALKPNDGDPNRVLISFFKACINIRRRTKTDMETLAIIINQTVPYLFTDPVGFNKGEAARKVAIANGNTGLFRIRYLFSPDAAIQPPPAWIPDNYKDYLSSDKGLAMFETQLLKTYAQLWEILDKKIGPPKIDVIEAVKLTAYTLKLAASWQFEETGVESNSSRFQESNTILQGIFGDNWTRIETNITGRRFNAENLQEILDKIPSTDLGRSLEPTQIALNLPSVFRGQVASFAIAKESLERFCLNSLAVNLRADTTRQFLRSLTNVDVLTGKVGEAFREIRRIMRFLYFSENLGDYLKPYNAFILRVFMNPRNNIALTYPFPFNNQTREFFQLIESFFVSYRPGPDYLLNKKETTSRFWQGLNSAWQEDRIKLVNGQVFELEIFRSEIHDSVIYENNVFPPIVLFDRPLFLNDMRVFDHAGTILFLTRNFLSLWTKNLDDYGPLKPLFLDFQLEDIENSRPLPSKVENFCEIQNKRVSRQQFLIDTLSRDALAFIISIQLLRNRTAYVSRAFKDNGTIARNVEPVFFANGSFDYYKVVSKENKPPTYEKLNKLDYVPFQEQIRKFQYKRAPNGLEDFTEEQLFFLASIRHHCYDLSRENITTQQKQLYVSKVNGVLEQVKELAEAWGCPLGSPMNPTNKCI